MMEDRGLRFPTAPAPSWTGALKVLLPLLLVASAALGLNVAFAEPRLSYELRGGELVIDSSLGLFDDGARLPLDQIREVERVRPQLRSRRAGTAVAGYCAGFWKVDGESASLATRCGVDLVALRMEDGDTWLVEPQDPQALIAALESGTEGSFPPPPANDERPMRWLAAILIPAAFLPLALMLRKQELRIEAGVLVVPAHFKALRVPLAGAKVWRGPLGQAWRVAGSGMPGLYLGLFRAGGRWVHVAASTKEGVWIEGERRIFVSPADPEAFLRAAMAAGAVLC